MGSTEMILDRDSMCLGISVLAAAVSYGEAAVAIIVYVLAL